jgi:hypothetical protein
MLLLPQTFTTLPRASSYLEPPATLNLQLSRALLPRTFIISKSQDLKNSTPQYRLKVSNSATMSTASQKCKHCSGRLRLTMANFCKVADALSVARTRIAYCAAHQCVNCYNFWTDQDAPPSKLDAAYNEQLFLQ